MSTVQPQLGSGLGPRKIVRSIKGSRGPLSGVFAIIIVAAVLATLSACVRADNIHLAVGMLALVIVCVPIVSATNYDLFSPWSFIVLTVVLGTTLRGAYMSFNLPDPATADFFWFMGNPPNYFLWPYCVLLLGLMSLTIGYMVAGRRTTIPLPKIAWKDQRLSIVGFVVLFVAIVATRQFIGQTGGAGSGKISAKRTVHAFDDVLGTSENHAHGALRKGAQLAYLGHLLFLAAVFTRKSQLRSIEMFLMLSLLVIGCVLPFYASSRSGMVYGLLQSLAVLYYSKRHISMGRLAVFGGVGVLGMMLFLLITQLRMSGEVGEFSLGKVTDSVVVNRNCCGCAKIAHIVNAVPELLDYQYGRTIGVWFLAPIPRSVWANKPLMHSGPIIGTALFGTVRGGVPASLIGELYWNFALPGVIIGCFLIGAAIKHIYLFIGPKRGGDLRRAVLYAFGPMMIGFQTVGTGIGFGFFNAMIQATLAYFAIRLVGGQVKRAASLRVRTPAAMRPARGWQARPAVVTPQVPKRRR